jgi:plastocyanin
MNDSRTLRLGRPHARQLLSLPLALALGLALVACGDDDDAEPDAEAENGAADAVSYEVDDLSYSDVTAPAGGTIEITNTSGLPHTFTAEDGTFDVDYGADESATVSVPDEPGEYPFVCEIHPQMEATLTVE